MIEILKKYKFEILFFILVIALFTYCGLNSFISGDDLHYSFYLGMERRVRNLSEVITTQKSEYLTVNGRFFVHCAVQAILIFGKSLFTILNSFFIVITIYFANKIVELKSKDLKIKRIFMLFIILGLILSIVNIKYIMYWVAGSLNYNWILALLLIFIYYYMAKGLNKNKILNCIIFFSFSILHEVVYVFFLFFIISDLIKLAVENGKDTKIKDMLWYILYLLFATLGGLVVLKAPGVAVRVTNAPSFYDMSFMERTLTSIPVVSKNLFRILYSENIVPTIFIILFIIYSFKNKCIIVKVFGFLIFAYALTSYMFDSGWTYFILAAAIFINYILICYLNKENDLSVFMIATYALVFSMIMTSEYACERPNGYMFMWMIINICIMLNRIFNKKIFIKGIELVGILFAAFMIYRECKCFSYIGSVYRTRLQQIKIANEEKLDTLKLKLIDSKYSNYHPSINSAASSLFKLYYGIDEDMEVEYVQ